MSERSSKRSNGHTPSAPRRMPIKTRRVDLDAEYEGWWWEFRTNPPLGRWAEGVRLATSYDEADPGSSANAVDGMLKVLEVVLVDWNFVDEDGNALPKDREGLDRLPMEIMTAMFSKVNESINEAPLVSSNA